MKSQSFAQIPNGFKSLFNGKNLKGWHVSRTSHQGTTPNFRVEEGMIVVTQEPYGQGGVLLSDKKYKNFELYIEVWVDSITNGGIFLRSTESGSAYQVELAGNSGSTGALLAERLPKMSQSVRADTIQKVWKKDDWNSIRIRMVGEIPHLTLWINDVLMWEVQQPENDFIAGSTEGMIGLQSHWTALFSPNAGNWSGLSSWAPGAKHRFRNIAIKKIGENSIE